MILSTVGYHWEEAFGAYDEFRNAGWDVALFTVDGSPPKVDPTSLKRTGPLSWFGLGVSKANSPESPRGRELVAAIEGVRPLADLDPESGRRALPARRPRLSLRRQPQRSAARRDRRALPQRQASLRGLPRDLDLCLRRGRRRAHRRRQTLHRVPRVRRHDHVVDRIGAEGLSADSVFE